MISDKMKKFIEDINYAYVASADQRSRPHLASASGLQILDPQHLAFEAWFCHKTMENIAEVPRLAVAIIDPSTGAGYQLLCRVEQTAQVGILDGYSPEMEEPGLPQTETRITVLIEEVLEFSHGPHTDHPIAGET
ncbi:MAG: pyridoxamine 5'-phosphate oxidase family protein [Desulfuromonadales bacterium]|nr:pyridoxamine 5'-phosphate oxidase family protein [Desulfuromonadales bacterium]